MSYKPHYIASFDADTGLNTYYEPFLIPEKAFSQLEDAFCWRGRVVRRPGFRLLGRLRRVIPSPVGAASIGNTGASPWAFNIYATLVAPWGPIAGEPNACIEPLSVVITIAGPITFTDNGDGTLSSVTPGNSGTINYSTGDVILTHTAGLGVATTIVFAYFPCLPVMGLRTRELVAINSEQLVAFDQHYAYIFNTTTNKFEEFIPGTTWRGRDFNFFWSTNYYRIGTDGLFWVTNTNMNGALSDPIRYTDGITWTTFEPPIAGTWAGTPPILTPTSRLYNAEIILPYKGRLICLNTWEGTVAGGIAGATNYPQRVRWSAVGNPLNKSPVPIIPASQIVAWLTTPGYGGVLDCATNEVIIGAEFIKDTLIVKFERSSYKLVYTGNEVLPFVFQKINTELGSESKFSLVPFDKGVFSVANVGITTDNSVDVERIDLQIPQVVFKFGNSDTTKDVSRVHGIRDYSQELVYWTYVDSDFMSSDPAKVGSLANQVLLYNYRNNTFAILNDSFMCYGYYQDITNTPWSGLTWFTWEGWSLPWNSPIYKSLFPRVVAGTQNGFVEIVGTVGQPNLSQASLSIVSINFAGNVRLYVPNHNLVANDVIFISGIIGGGTVNPAILNGLTYKVTLVVDENRIEVQWFDGTSFLPITGLVDVGSIYLGNGVIAKYNNFSIATKVFAPFYEQGSQCRLGYVDYLLTKTSDGEFTSDVYVDENDSFSMSNSTVNSSLPGDNTINTGPENTALIPFQQNQSKIWHRQFTQTIAQNFRLVLSLTPEQNADIPICGSTFELHALAFYLSPNARMTQ